MNVDLFGIRWEQVPALFQGGLGTCSVRKIQRKREQPDYDLQREVPKVSRVHWG